jgi:hypothetical protein
VSYQFEDKIKTDKKKERDDLLKRERTREIDDVKKVISSPEGRRFLWKLMGEAGVFRSSFTGNSETFFNEGKRSIGLLILSEVNNANLGAFTQMQNESVNEQKKLSKQLEGMK